MFHQGVGLVGFVRITVAKIRILSKMMKRIVILSNRYVYHISYILLRYHRYCYIVLAL